MTSSDQQPVPGGSGAGRLRCRDCARVVGDAHTVVNPDHQVEAIGSGAGSTVDLFFMGKTAPEEHDIVSAQRVIKELRTALEVAQGELRLAKAVSAIVDEAARMDTDEIKQLKADLAQARAMLSRFKEGLPAVIAEWANDHIVGEVTPMVFLNDSNLRSLVSSIKAVLDAQQTAGGSSVGEEACCSRDRPHTVAPKLVVGETHFVVTRWTSAERPELTLPDDDDAPGGTSHSASNSSPQLAQPISPLTQHHDDLESAQAPYSANVEASEP